MIIELLDGTRYDIEDYGVCRLFHHIPSAEIDHSTETINGGGDIITESTIKQRTISVDIGYKVNDIFDFYLLREELNGLFMRKEAFYIIFKREPYKRWFVKIDKQFNVPTNQSGGQFSLEFRTVKKYAESIATTASKKEWDEDLWWWNGKITWDDPLQYTFASNSFTVVNLGNVEIDPAERGIELEITIKATASNLTIRNLTNGSTYVYNGSLSSTDTLKISGIRSLKNGISVFKDTNKDLLTLSPGANRIEVTGGTVQSITFDHRFLFK